MPILSRNTHLERILLCFVVFFSAGCSQAAVAPTATLPASRPTASTTPIPPTLVAPTLPATWTATSDPSATATQNLLPTAANTITPTLGAAEDGGLSAWCIAEHASVSQTADPTSPPPDAKIAQWSGKSLEVNNLPSNGCVFIYTFNQAVTQPLKLEVFDKGIANAFITTDLIPVPADANSVYTVLRHSYIIAPPVWDVSFTFVVSNQSGVEVRRDTVNLHRWTPALCWNGRRPNPLTLRCPLQQDLHPWDPSYRTPFPTPLPEDD